MAARAIDRQTSGVFIIAATPFDEAGAIDEASIERLAAFYLERGVAGLTVLGIMGEAAKLSPDEAAAVLGRFLAAVEGRVPVVVGASGGGIDLTAGLSHRAMEAGAAGIMVAPPPSATTEARVMGYYGDLCAALGPEVPVCLQDFPQASAVHLSVATIRALTAEHPQIVMLKHEDWPGLSKITAVRRAEAEGAPRMSILCGNGGLFLDAEMARGADGAMTGFAYPEMLVEVVRLSAAGEHERARDIFDAYLPLVRYEQQPGLGLAVRKEILRRRGAIATARVRAPGPRLGPEEMAEIDWLIERLERRLAALG